jgi:hypothetical protein
MIPLGGRKPVLARRTVDLAPGAAAADTDGAGLWIDLDVLQQREVDHHAVVDRPEPGAVVSAVANRQWQVLPAREGDRLRDVLGVGAPCDQPGALVEHRVVDPARVVVVGVLGADQPPPEAGELPARRLYRCRDCAQVCTSWSWMESYKMEA